MSMQLTISQLRKSETMPIEWLEVETLVGNLIVQKGHAPEYVIVKNDTYVQWALESGALEKIKIKQALLKIDRNTCLLIIEG